MFSSILAVFCYRAFPTHIKKNCSRFKTGEFTLKSHLNGSYSLIDRNDSIQIETSMKSGAKVTARIKWTTECDYELQYLNQTRIANDTITQILQVRPVKFKILKTGKDYYVFEGRIDSVDFVYSDTMFLKK